MDTRAITPYEQFKTIVSKDEIQARFKDILGKKAPGFLASVINAVYLDDNLRECDPNSIISSALKAAVFDLPIEKELGFAFLIPYNSKKGKKAQFQIGYKGYIQLALRTGQYEKINVTPIYEGETIHQDRLTGDIVLTGFQKSSLIQGYAGYFRLKTGFEKFIYMAVEEIRAHAQKYARSYNDPKSKWQTDFDAMARKTIIRMLIPKYGVLTIQMTEALKADENDWVDKEDIIDAEPAEDLGPEYPPDMQPDEPPEYAPDPEPAKPPKPSNGDGVYQAVVDAKLSENVISAKNALSRYCHTGYDTPEKAIAWFKLFRGWRDKGFEAPEAATKANQGELPE